MGFLQGGSKDAVVFQKGYYWLGTYPSAGVKGVTPTQLQSVGSQLGNTGCNQRAWGVWGGGSWK